VLILRAGAGRIWDLLSSRSTLLFLRAGARLLNIRRRGRMTFHDVLPLLQPPNGRCNRSWLNGAAPPPHQLGDRRALEMWHAGALRALTYGAVKLSTLGPFVRIAADDQVDLQASERRFLPRTSVSASRS
jgi:hypothetical protein